MCKSMKHSKTALLSIGYTSFSACPPPPALTLKETKSERLCVRSGEKYYFHG
uniref:Uncharacterized protein n=1 Tax=Anguilla anguilla TaxID=7936 RepID=A0A0E9QWW2_ANGAN